ncbi:MAG TPA: DNA-3-methyladenine glycosylase I [Acidobacteriota bacterium]|nr:DNA-3-methyladenine glycosylase I [Acidobacteriota bacterium]
MKSYCSFARSQPVGNHHRDHHDSEHGIEPENDDDLFRRLMLEISQAGLSFDIALKRKHTIYKAFPTINKVAKFTKADVDRLMQDPGIIRNKLKIEAAISNAKKIQELQKEYGSFKAWLDKNHPKSRDEWTTLFKKTFRFTGGEIINELMMSCGYLPGAHDKDCHMWRKK